MIATAAMPYANPTIRPQRLPQEAKAQRYFCIINRSAIRPGQDHFKVIGADQGWINRQRHIQVIHCLVEEQDVWLVGQRWRIGRSLQV